jgi:signal transduction histidine kinase
VIEGLLNAEHVPPADPAAAAQIAESQAQLREGLRALEVKNHFLDLISHELRNTLATMKTAAFCLKEGVGGTLTARQTDLVAMISNNVDRQTRVIDNLIDLTDFRPGKLSFDFRQTDVRKIILDLVRELGLKSAPRELEADVDRSLPLIKGDPDLLTQVLRSLIGNALRFAKSKVVVRASAAGARGLSISVADDGEGILPERLEAKGLGLSICEEIVAGHHGKLWAESAPGKGALMSVLLPASGLAPSYAGDR